MPKGLGPIALEKGMTDPGEAVAGEGCGGKKAPVCGKACREKAHRKKRSQIMAGAGARIGMRPQIGAPELPVAHEERPDRGGGMLVNRGSAS